MKKIILGFLLYLGSLSGFAGFLPITYCVNATSDGFHVPNIAIYFDPNRDDVSLVHVFIKKWGHTAAYLTFNVRELKLTETLLQTMPSKKKGTSLTTITFKEITLEKADGSKMVPDEHTQEHANDDGSLVDYFICQTTQVSYTGLSQEPLLNVLVNNS